MSEMLPDPKEILVNSTYAPDAHRPDATGEAILPLPQQPDNIAAIPDHPDAYLLWYPYNVQSARNLSRRLQWLGKDPDAVPDSDVLSIVRDRLPQIHETQLHHMELLRQAGIKAVRHTTAITPVETSDWEGDTWVACVQRLEAGPLTHFSPQGHHVMAGLQQYINACKGKPANEPSIILSDIYGPNRYYKQGATAVLAKIQPQFGLYLTSVYDIEVARAAWQDRLRLI